MRVLNGVHIEQRDSISSKVVRLRVGVCIRDKTGIMIT